MAPLLVATCTLLFLQDRKVQGPLKGREKELMWRELLKEILPGPSVFITLPYDVDFDAPETEIKEKGECNQSSKCSVEGIIRSKISNTFHMLHVVYYFSLNFYKYFMYILFEEIY